MRTPSMLTRLLAVSLATVVLASPAFAEKGGQGKGGGKGASQGKGHGGGSSNKGSNKGGGHGNSGAKAKGPKKFESSQRSAIQSYYRDEYASSGNCPPGLAKKNNGCMPPGQAKRWSEGSYLPADLYIAPVPPSLVATLVAPMPGYSYGYVDGGVVLFGTSSRVVVDFVAVFP